MTTTITTPAVLSTEIAVPPPFVTTLQNTAPFVTTLQVGQGPRGASGLNGGANFFTFEVQVLVDGAQSIVLPVDIYQDKHQLRINGLAQSKTSYSVLGRVITLPADLNIMAGDFLAFDYFPTL